MTFANLSDWARTGPGSPAQKLAYALVYRVLQQSLEFARTTAEN